MFKSKKNLFGIVCISLSLVGCKDGDHKDKNDLTQQFQNEFGFSPDIGVENIQCKTVSVGDTSSKWMSFNCEDSIFQKIIVSDRRAAN